MPGVFLLLWHTTTNKVREALCMAPLCEMEIQAFWRLLQRNHFAMRVVLEDELLQQAQSSAVRDFLPHLHDGVPRMRRKGPLAILTLLVYNLELHDHGLLQYAGSGHLLLHCDLDTDAHGVLLGPNERGINKPHVLADALDTLEAQTQQFPRLWLGFCPWGPVVPATIPASRQSDLSCDSFYDGYLRLQTLRASHRLIGNHGHSATTAQHGAGGGPNCDLVVLPLHPHSKSA
mmetsp:Transcript_139414/g.347629  ORF Transcript_139414/g.347629 Transcript_139414/m.347629 type:complete len:232 (-) Transcript_139414:45-740(-)